MSSSQGPNVNKENDLRDQSTVVKEKGNSEIFIFGVAKRSLREPLASRTHSIETSDKGAIVTDSKAVNGVSESGPKTAWSPTCQVS